MQFLFCFFSFVELGVLYIYLFLFFCRKTLKFFRKIKHSSKLHRTTLLVLLQTLKSLKVRVSVIGLSAEVRVCTVLTRETGGSYHVILDESHFKELLMLHVKPPPASSSSECSLIRMGQYDMISV